MRINVKIINAFSVNNLGGNPAGVVLDAEKLDSETKQLIAAKLGISETAFVSTSVTADFKLEFFTPTKQIAHCGHATIATFSYLKQIGKIKANHSSKETIDGLRNIYFEGDNAFMEQKSPSYQIPKESINNILTSLNLKTADIPTGLMPTIVNTGNSFLIIPVNNETILKEIQPDYEKIKQVSEQYHLIGYYAYTSTTDDKNVDATSRMFAPLYGIDEESATGMAAGPLGCFLYDNGIGKTNINIQQGKFMNIPSASLLKININIKEDKIINLFAGGSAYTSNEVIIEI